MGDANPIRILGDYSKPSHEGYMNTIELPVGNNVVPLRSDAIRLVQNGCSFHGLRLEDPNQHLKDFLRLFQFFLRGQASHWLERLPAGSITTWEDLTTRFLAQFFPPRRTAKLRNDILIARMTVPFAKKSAIKTPTDLGKSLRTPPSMTMRTGMTQKNSLNRSRLFLHLKPPQKRPDQRLLELEDQITFLLKRSQSDAQTELNTRSSSLCRKAAQSLCPGLGTTFEARVRDYMAAHTERMERFENAIFKQREEINDRMAEMFGLLKELTTSRAPKKQSATDIEKPTGTETGMPVKEAEKENEAENGIKNEPIRKAGKEETTEAPSSQSVEYYLKHMINEKIIEGLVDNHRFNDSLSGARVGKRNGRIYNLLPRGTVYEAILKKKITRKEDIGGNFEIPSNHSYIYPLGIAEDVLVEVAEHVYPVDFVILDINRASALAGCDKGASIKTLEIQIGQMSKILQERGFRSLPKSTESNPRDHVKSISTIVEADTNPIRRMGSSQYAVSTLQNSKLIYETRQTTISLLSRLNDYYCEEKKGPVSVIPLSTYLSLGLGELAHTKLIVELADRTVKYPKGITENMLVGDEKIIFKSVKPASSLIKRVYMLSLREREARLMGETLVLNRSLEPLYGDYIELNDINIPLELRRDQVDDLMPTIEEGKVVEEVKARNDRNMVSKIFGYPIIYDQSEKIRIDCAHNLKFSCMIGFEFIHTNFLPSLRINVMFKKFYNSIMKDKIKFRRRNKLWDWANVPIFIGNFYVLTNFTVVEDMDPYLDEGMREVVVGKPFCEVSYVETKRFDGMITIHGEDECVTY
ncbi:zinc finger, CCHC-type containing protein [Tanacetum coccineum]